MSNRTVLWNCLSFFKNVIGLREKNTKKIQYWTTWQTDIIILFVKKQKAIPKVLSYE